MKTVKFGIIGAGQIAHSSCRWISTCSRAELAGATDINEENLKKLAAAFGIKRTFSKSDDLLADRDIDAVYIAVPNAFHAPLAIAALNAGKHVILEKPFALNFSEAQGVVDSAGASGKLFMLGMNQRFSKEAQAVKYLVENGRLGEVYRAKASWSRRAGIPGIGTWFGKKKLAGGGALLDIGVHMLDLSLFLMDNFEPESVSGATYAKFGNRGLGGGSWGMSEATDTEFDVDDLATALIKLKGGATLTLDASWARHARESDERNVWLFGTEGGAQVYSPELYVSGKQGKEYTIIQNPSTELKYGHCNRFHNFINAILGEEELGVTAEQALAVQKIIDGIYESCATGREVRFD